MKAPTLFLKGRRGAATLALVTGAALLATAAGRSAQAQSVSPVISEYHGGAAAGSFDLTNDSLASLVITIEPKSFSISRAGQGEFRPLDHGIQVSFSQTSLRLPPHSRRTIFYTAKAENYPAWFSVYATFRGMPKQNGVSVALELPHTVYLLRSEKMSRVAKAICCLRTSPSTTDSSRARSIT